ncbi:MAG: nuclear transport factor 2 family protein [Thermoleophilaceae bacterium]
MDVALVESAYEAWNRRDVERLIELTHPDVEMAPLVLGAISSGPWQGHDGVRRLVAQAEKWARFEIQCEEILTFGELAVALVRVEVAARPDSPTVTGDIAHVIEFDGDRARRFAAYRDRGEAIAAAKA